MNVQEEYKQKLISIEQFGKLIKSGDNIATGLGLEGINPALHEEILVRSDEHWKGLLDRCCRCAFHQTL